MPPESPAAPSTDQPVSGGPSSGGPSSGGPKRWQLIGGHRALDLCNTRSWRLDQERSRDRIAEPEQFLSWYAAAIEPTPKGPAAANEQWRASDPELRQVIERIRILRDDAIGVLDAHIDGRSADPRHLDALVAAWRQSIPAVSWSPRLPLVWALDVVTPADLFPYLTLTVIDLLQRTDLDRLTRCDGPGCGWLFLDHTRNHSRRWCDPADCGNRVRVRAYAERHRRDQARPEAPGPTQA
jgi:predicted RNA-binding Zn ribbon-like protein